MKNGNAFRRALSILLLICMVLSLAPMGVMATEPVEEDPGIIAQDEKTESRSIPTTATLINLINTLQIPSITQVSNWDTLSGLYFMACGGRTFDHTGGTCKTMGYLNLANNDASTQIEQKNGLPTVAFSVSGNRALINGKEPDLTHAVILSHTINSEYEMPDSLSSSINDQLDDALSNQLSYGPQKDKYIYALLNLHKDTYKSINCDLNIYTYDIQFYNTNKFLNFNKWENVSLGTNKRYPIMLHPSKTTNVVKMYKTNVYSELDGDGNIIAHSYWIGVDGYVRENVSLSGTKANALTAATAAQIRRNNYGDRKDWPYKHQKFSTDWTIYKVAPQTLELYKTLTSTVKNFLNSGNPNGKYSDEAFNGYLLSVQKCIDYYKTHYTNPSAPDTVTKQCTAYCEMLTQSITMMNNEAGDKADLDKLSADPSKYMDVPVTILDFRSDGLMFENLNSVQPYALSHHSQDVQNEMNQNVPVPIPGRYDGQNRVDLTLETLVDGYPVYRKETVDFIAQALFKKYKIPGSSVFDPYWNNIFVNMVNSGFTTDKDGDGVTGLGSWENTLKQTSTPGFNGGVLLFKNVDTAYDLAYYILNHIWRPVGAADTILDSQTVNGNTFPVHYNKVVSELHTLRMTKDDAGYYHFKSDLDVGRDLDRGIIFNTGKALTDKAPKLNVLTDLGFEHPDLYGNDNTGPLRDRDGSTSNCAPRTNYNYGLHVHSVFVYYNDKNLNFTFKGDDDVYFFINGQLACDVGGMHTAVEKTLYVNNIAAKLDLHDGDICTFDMFFVDRHSWEVNLNFSTNIEMMRAAAVTREDQHYYTGTESKGQDIREGSIVEENTEIGYNYKLLNRSDYAVNHVTYTDPNLGVTMSKDGINLNGKAEAGNLIVTYRSYDPIASVFAEGEPVVHTREPGADFTENSLYLHIKAAVEKKDTIMPMPGQVHEIRGLTESDLMLLLELGIPANVQMEIYGTHQPAIPNAEQKCISTLRTQCYPLDAKDNQGDPLTGADQRSVVVEDVSAVTVAEPLHIVLDYGKAVEISAEEIEGVLKTEGSAVVSLLGLTHEGHHGTTTKNRPSNLKCIDPGDRYTCENGTYELRGNKYRFTLSRFLEEVEQINAVFCVSTRTGVNQWYIMVTVELMPATNIYYEAEAFVGTEFTYEEVSDQGSKNEFDVVSQDNGYGILDPVLQSYATAVDPTNDKSILYFGFNKDPKDDERYAKNSIYNNKNYDTNGVWSGTSGYTLNITGGVLNYSASPVGTETWTALATGTGFTGLNFTPGIEDWIEIRIKINDTAALSNPSVIKFDLELHRDSSHFYKIAHTSQVVPYGNLDTNEFYTIRFPLPTKSGWETDTRTVPYCDIGTVTRLVFIPTGVKSGSRLNYSLDYMYIGPREKLPSAQNRHLLFDFGNSAAEQYRYQSEIYNGINYALGTNWMYTSTRTSAVSVENGAMKITHNLNDKDHFSYVYTNSAPIDHALKFSPSVRDYCQVRLKIENAKAVDGTMPYFGLYFSYENQAVTNAMREIKHFSLTDHPVGQWFILTFPITNSLWYEAETISGIRMELGNMESSNGQSPTFYVDYCYVGPSQPQDLTVDHNTEVYGYDSTYTDDAGLSDGKSLFIEGQGVRNDDSVKNYSEASFTFTGTGFDLISRTGNMQGTIRVTVYDVNGEMERKLTVDNKGELELYQIPVVSIEDLPYGEHRVVIGVNKALSFTGVLAPLSRGGEFYLDAVRIYDPIVAQENVLTAYVQDKEAYPYIKEVRDVLLSADDFNALVGESNGAVFVDQAEEKPSYPEIPAPDGSEPTEYVPIDPETGKPVESLPVDPDLNVDNHITDRIITYEKVGPKNEVYLGSGQSIAFKLRLNTVQIPVSIDVGAKTIDKNGTAVLSVGHTTTAEAPASRREWTVSSNTAMYYATDITADSFDEEGCLYLVITNTGADSVLSITDIKFAYDTEPTLIQEGQPPVTRSAPVGDLVSFTVDGGLAEAVQKVLDAELPMDEPEILDETIAIRHTLNLASDIAVNYVVERAVVDAYDSAVLEVKVPVYEGNALVGYETVPLEPVDKGYYYYFILEGLTAVHMNNMLEATLRLEKDGVKTVSATDVYSIATYAYGQLNKTGISESLQKLCADLLQYGARAQIFKGYRTEALADSLMTVEQRAIVTDLATVTFGITYAVGTELAEPSVTWIGKALELNSKVGLKFVFSAQGYEGAVEDLTLRVTYVNAVGQTCTAVVEGPVAYNEAAAQYAFLFDGLTAAELRQAVKVQIYNGDTPLSCAMTYSADTYGNGKTGTLLDLCRALFAYSDSAKAFFV